MYSMYSLQHDGTFYIEKCNYIKHASGQSYLSPIKLEFVVNPQLSRLRDSVNTARSITKVFDSQ